MYSYKIWDKKSPVNGVKASEVIKIHKITSGEVGLVFDEAGRVSVLQYNNGNPLTKEELVEQLKEITEQMNNPPAEENEETAE